MVSWHRIVGSADRRLLTGSLRRPWWIAVPMYGLGAEGVWWVMGRELGWRVGQSFNRKAEVERGRCLKIMHQRGPVAATGRAGRRAGGQAGRQAGGRWKTAGGAGGRAQLLSWIAVGVRQHVHAIDDWVPRRPRRAAGPHVNQRSRAENCPLPRCRAKAGRDRPGSQAQRRYDRGHWDGRRYMLRGSSREFPRGPRNPSERQCASGLPERECG